MLVRDGTGRCPKHQRVVAREVEARRESSTQRGYGYKWQVAREQFLREQPLCRKHKELGQIVVATVVDHIVPHRNDQALFWNRANWQPLCKPCHDLKTATEDGAFGRARRGPAIDVEAREVPDRRVAGLPAPPGGSISGADHF